MDDETRQRLEELEERAEYDELDEDEREELRELHSQAREEKRAAKSLAKFDKATVVYRVADSDDGDFYTLDLATAQKWAGPGPIETVQRSTLAGKFRTVTIEGSYGEGDNWGREEVYIPE